MKERSLNDETRDAWNANASFWDGKMGDGNDFANILLWPAILRMLGCAQTSKQKGYEKRQGYRQQFPLTGVKILDIATGNGVAARRLAKLGAIVTAIDFSDELIALAKARTPEDLQVTYVTMDATREQELVKLGEKTFDCAVCNMALFDMAEIEPLFHAIPTLLKPGGTFIFSITHPAFNNSSSVHVAEEYDDGNRIETVYSVKISRYMTPYHAHGLAMRDQPRPQVYFERPLQEYLNAGFRNGFVLDAFEEVAFPPDHPQTNPLSWGGKFSEIPPVLIARMRINS
jgi:ubiquinone/menaquinone biosynthesis C-methylase UbiE